MRGPSDEKWPWQAGDRPRGQAARDSVHKMRRSQHASAAWAAQDREVAAAAS